VLAQCAACPRIARGLDGLCEAQTSGHVHYCHLAAQGDHGHDERLCGAAGIVTDSRAFLEQRRLLALVAACPDRGDVLPVSQQAPGCKSCERTACRKGLGATPGAVSLAECLYCRGLLSAAG
jgi:hypothetical protein